MKLFGKLYFILLGSVFLASSLGVAQDSDGGGGVVVQDKDYRFSVNIDSKTGSVSVSTLESKAVKSKSKTPSNMSITLFRDPDTNETIQLQSVQLPRTSALPQFQGSLTPEAQSYMGFELSFATSTKGLHKLRYLTGNPASPANTPMSRPKERSAK